MPTKKLTPNQSKFVKLVKSIIGRRKSYEDIENVLCANEFVIVNSGSYKSVFKRPGDNYCVKVWRYEWGWKEDSYKVPKLLKNHYIHPIFKNTCYLIQKWIKSSTYGCKNPIKKLPSKIRDSLYDIREDNIMIYGKREVVIDFCYDRY